MKKLLISLFLFSVLVIQSYHISTSNNNSLISNVNAQNSITNPYIHFFSSSTLSKLNNIITNIENKKNGMDPIKFNNMLKVLDNKLGTIKRKYNNNNTIWNLISYLQYEIKWLSESNDTLLFFCELEWNCLNQVWPLRNKSSEKTYSNSLDNKANIQSEKKSQPSGQSPYASNTPLMFEWKCGLAMQTTHKNWLLSLWGSSKLQWAQYNFNPLFLCEQRLEDNSTWSQVDAVEIVDGDWNDGTYNWKCYWYQNKVWRLQQYKSCSAKKIKINKSEPKTYRVCWECNGNNESGKCTSTWGIKQVCGEGFNSCQISNPKFWINSSDYKYWKITTCEEE